MNKKNKIKYLVKIGKFIKPVEISNKNNEIESIEKYAKISLTRTNNDYIKIAEKELNIKLEKCPFCGENSKYKPIFDVNLHEKTINLISVELKKEENGLVNKHCKRGRKLCSGGNNNPNSIEYISIAYGISKEEANKYLLSRNKSPFYSVNYENIEEYKKSQSKNIGWYISRYGEEEGKKKYDKFRKTMEIKSSNNYIIKTRGEEYLKNLNSKKAQTLVSFIKKYGEEIGKDKWEAYKKSVGLNKKNFIEKYGKEKWEKNRESINYKKSLDYSVQIYGKEEGERKHQELLKSYSFTKEDYIKKYGEEKWLERIIKNTSYYSKEACLFFELLLKKLDNINFTDLRWKDDEFFLWDHDMKRIYFYDFYFEIGGKKIIIEYDNFFWHPKENNGKNFTKWKNSKISFEEKKEYDERKSLWAKYKGYHIINLYFEDKKNPMRNNSIWDPYLEKLVKEIKNIIKC